MQNEKVIYPHKTNASGDDYSGLLMQEYTQSFEEGKDIEAYRGLFEAVSSMPSGNIKEDMSDALFRLVLSLDTRKDYEYDEPDELPEIASLSDGGYRAEAIPEDIESRIRGAWYGRICGCLLGKPIEGIRTNELLPLLNETGNYPLTRYILAKDITDGLRKRLYYDLSADKCWADVIDKAPADDDTNYTVMASLLIDRFGRSFTSDDVLEMWTQMQPKNAYFTAERIAFINYVNKYRGHDNAVYKNPYREFIGAQIRVDYYGYINAGAPSEAAEMAYRDSYASHTKNGIYGAMFVAAMISRAAVSDDIEDIIRCGLSYVPKTSRLHKAVTEIVSAKKSGKSLEECRKLVYEAYDEYTLHGWCHTVSNAMIVTMALLYGNGDYGASVTAAVQTGFDTDCNGATVGSIIGMMKGENAIGDEWTAPVNGILKTSIFGMNEVSIESMVQKTLVHLKR